LCYNILDFKKIVARKRKQNKRKDKEQKRFNFLPLPSRAKRIVFGTLFFLLSMIVFFSFFGMSGVAGQWLRNQLVFLLGATFFLLPLVFFFMGVIFLKTRYKRYGAPVGLSSFLLILGISGIFQALSDKNGFFTFNGGWLGRTVGSPLMGLFDIWISLAIMFCVSLVGFLILKQMLHVPGQEKEEEKQPSASRFKKIFGREPSFETQRITKEESIAVKEEKVLAEEKLKVKIVEKKEDQPYDLPSPDLLESDKGAPSSGDTKINSAIIRNTLENFDIPVEMSEISVGPTVTQYTLKPSEGIKLSRITSLSNDLSLALAAHPIRIEAPIPGRSLVGVEIPNKIRAEIRMKNLISSPSFQNSANKLPLVLGRDVSGMPQYATLEKMPHLLVAGATGTGKTIFLNVLILSLLYRNTPRDLRLILVDPKRVEFTNYSDIPHLLAPVIFDVGKTCNALKWLVGEMERRLGVLSEAKARDIGSYNEIVAKNNGRKNGETMEPMPYIVLIIDELADLMASKGREVEAGIVRLAQMARASGIHLILATQRPSVEVITGLIKANVTSRITFQVASQVDSRTVLDTSGAEKLLGAGDLLFISGEISKPKRIQGPYVSEKEVRDVVSWIKKEHKKMVQEENGDELSQDLEKDLEKSNGPAMLDFSVSEDDDDSLYEEAKKLIIETRKASASFLQRRLKIGYARAARLLDILEERGIVGPADGAKPREIYYQSEEDQDNWHKV
jgi:DNA segregation ATPase FtsK/SpoIIIE, S-DNA-T family